MSLSDFILGIMGALGIIVTHAMICISFTHLWTKYGPTFNMEKYNKWGS